MTHAMLEGRHAVVTGGGRGIGAAIAAVLAAEGADLTLMGRDLPALTDTAARLRDDQGVRVEAIAVDVTDEHSVADAFTRARDRLGDPSILVNNAGQAGGAPFDTMTRSHWDAMLAVNLTGAFLCARQTIAGMLALGGGRIVNIASTAGLHGVPHVTAYAAAKHGVVGLTRSLALEYAKRGITVNAVCPNYTDTAMAERAVEAVREGTGRTEEEALRAITRASPFGRLVRPGEVADAVVWLCSPAATAITGQAIAIG